MSVTGLPSLSCTMNLNSIATPAFSGPAGRCQIIFPPSEIDALVEFAAAEADVSGSPDQVELSPTIDGIGLQPGHSSGVRSRLISPTNVHGKPRRSTTSAKIL